VDDPEKGHEQARDKSIAYDDQVVASPYETTQYLLGAKGAMKHVTDKENDIQMTLSRYGISKKDHYVQVGFNESLIARGAGHLQEIYVVSSVELLPDSPIFIDLGKIFSPYPGIVFTPSTSNPTPVFKDNGDVWDLDDLALTRTERGISTPLLHMVTSHDTNIISCTRSVLSTGVEGSSVGVGGNSNDGKGDDQGGKGGKGKQPWKNHGTPHERKDDNRDSDDENGGNPDDPDGNRGRTASSPRAFFDVLAKVYCGDSTPRVFQELQVTGEVVSWVCSAF
jgi:hypothetical protein